jgi:hypothetical protein
MLNGADNMKAALLERQGIDYRDCTSEQFLNLALEAEETAKQCGPFDPAFQHFTQQVRAYTDAAALAEKEGR